MLYGRWKNIKTNPSRTLTVLSLLIFSLVTQSHPGNIQSDSIETERLPVWLTPSPVDKIYGLAIMPFASGMMFQKKQTVNGIGLHGLGVGLLLPLIPSLNSLRFNIEDDRVADSLVSKTLNSSGGHLLRVNGALFSITGTAAEINGVSISLFCSGHSYMNGVSISPFINTSFMSNGLSISAVNDSFRVRGLQIGIFNTTHHLHGVQIGILNRSKKRMTPFINWTFDN